MDASSPNPSLPALHEATLDNEALARLFNDLSNSAVIERVIVKSDGMRRADAAPLSLEAARAAFESGAAAAVQVRYTYDGASWCDTILRTPTGAKVVRIRLFNDASP